MNSRRSAGRRAAISAAWGGVLFALILLRTTAAAERTLPPGLDDAVGHGLEYLSRHQNSDGTFDAGDGPPYRTATTGLALLAFLSAGDAPDTGRYGLVVRRAIDALTALVPKDGFVGKGEERGMYAQGIATLALAQAYGVEGNIEKRQVEAAALARLVQVILKAQEVKKEPNFAGGWRYAPDAADSDISVCGWNALALRASQDAGLTVPADALVRAAEFVARCYNKSQNGFAYQPGGAALTSATGTGVLCLHLLERSDRPEVAAGAKFLVARPVDDNTQFPYYSAFYVTQAAYQSGDETWAAVAGVTLDRLLKSQEKDGGWPSGGKTSEPGRGYRTCMAVLTLAVPYRILPIYQR